jgi:hypothetical protein
VAYTLAPKDSIVTQALFSDVRARRIRIQHSQAIKTKYGHKFEFADNVAIPDIEYILRDYAMHIMTYYYLPCF